MLKRIKNFLKNTSGGIMPTVAILAVPLTIAAGVALDYTKFTNLRNDIQTSLDAASIATSRYLSTLSVPQNITDEDAITAYKTTKGQEYATNFFLANVDDNVSSDNYSLVVNVSRNGLGEENVTITGSITYDSIFGAVKKGDDSNFYRDILTTDIVSSTTLGNRTIEVALVLDNSGSMGTFSNGIRRIERMKDASQKLVRDLYASAAGSVLEDPVKFSLVPFSGTVNVGPLGHENLDGNFIDTRGFNPVNNENLDWLNTFVTDEPIRTPGNHHRVRIKDGDFLSRLTIFDMLDEPWSGCVEMRPWPHNVLDTYVEDRGGYNRINNTMDIDGDGVNDGANALFVPYFAPDEPDHRFAERADADWTDYDFAPNVDHDDDDDSYSNNYLYDFQLPDGGQLLTDRETDITRNKANNKSQLALPDIASGIRDSELQVNRTNWVFKYQRDQRFPDKTTFGDTFGPNDGCRTDPITALVDDQDGIIDAIEDMSANGTTNIQQGLTWGWRTLSAGLPFDQGRPSTDRVNMKFIILLTDGNNFYSTDGDSTPNESAYGAWGYTRPDTHPLTHAVSGEPTHNRMADGMDPSDLLGTIYAGQTFDLTPNNGGEFTALMNVHTAQACENIKADGISIYTIVYDLNDQNTINLMEACAGPGIIKGEEVIAGVQFFHQAQGSSLDDTFREIASSISAIRVTK